jgi:exodeoxyribonuclease V gamma subunit
MPMRAIPFRHVCLLGMNDGDYPRSRTPLDFDLMRRDYRPGDRLRREDDRYLFLEALLSARDHLHISWIGRSVTDNTPRPPSVLVGQLRDHLKSGWRLEGDEESPNALVDALTIEHRLQPFSVDYFPAQPEASQPLYTYAFEWSRSAPLRDAAAQAALLPPPERDEPVSIGELADFLRDPVRSFFRQRLRVGFEAEDAASENHEPFEVDALQAWQLQSELIRAQVAAMERGEDDLEPVALERLERMHRSGDLATGGFGEVIGQELLAPMGELFIEYRKALARWPEPLEHQYEIRLDAQVQGREITIDDWIDDLRAGPDGARGRVILDAGTLIKLNKYRSDRLVAYWVAHVAAQLAAGAVTTVIVSKAGVAEFAPIAPAAARDYLIALLNAWDEGARRPLPLAIKTAFAWLRRLPDTFDGSRAAVPDEAWADARTAFEGALRSPGECEQNPWLRRAFPDFETLVESDEFITLATTLLLPVQRAPLAGSRAKRDAATAGETA